MAQTQPRQNYHAESEAGVNKQINLELYASYTYHSMVCTDFNAFYAKYLNSRKVLKDSRYINLVDTSQLL